MPKTIFKKLQKRSKWPNVFYFYFCGETNKYFIFYQKTILRYFIHLCDKYNELLLLEHFLKHSSFGDILILRFACSYISYVAEQKKSLK